MARNRKKEVKQRGILLAVWIIFLVVLGLFGCIAYKKRDIVSEDLGFTTRFAYQTNANPDINALIITYLSATAAGDQDILKSCVTDPSQYDDMTNVQNKSKIITAYSNINCYSVEGKNPSDTLVYAVANISIVNVESTPLDMLGPFYIVKEDGKYLIDNRPLDDSVNKYIEKAGKNKDIQDLYLMVKADEEKKAEQDPAFKEFLDRLGN